MAWRADESGGFGLLGEFLFDGFIAARDAKNHVHFGARRFFDRAGIKFPFVEQVVQKLGFGVVVLFHRGDAAGGFEPVEDQSNDVNREGGRGVVEGFFLDVGAVLQERWQVLVGALGEVFANDYDGGSRRAEIFLCAGNR